MKKRYVIVAGSPCFEMCCEIEPSDVVIACDAGYDHCKKYNIIPDLILGDFDSCQGKLQGLSIPVLTFPPEKDDTDTSLALNYAINHGAEEIIILGGTGARLDHFIANLQLLAKGAEAGVMCSMLDKNNIIYMLCGGKDKVNYLSIPNQFNWSVSLLSFSDSCFGVSSTGLKYPLCEHKLTNNFPLGVSNEFNGNLAEIRLKSGLLLVILSKK